jgi:transposase
MKPSKEQLLRYSNKPIADLASMYGVTKQAVSLWLKSYGIKRRNVKVGEFKKINKLPVPPKDDLLYLKDLTLKDIAIIYNVSTGTVSRWYQECNIKRIDFRSYNNRVFEKIEIPPKEDLEKLSDLTYVEIGEKYKVSVTAVWSWFNHYGMCRNGGKGEPIDVDKPIEIEPIEVKPIDVEPIEIKPIQSKPIQSKPKPIEIKPKPIDAKPIEISIPQMRLDLVNQILNASDDLLLALNTILERK